MFKEDKMLLRSHEDFQSFKQRRAAEALAELLPRAFIYALLGGEMGARQICDASERRSALVSAICLKAGPEGQSLSKAARALRELYEFAKRRSMLDFVCPV